MVATWYLIGCVLIPAQPSVPSSSFGEHIPGPRPGKSQEFVYRGTYEEESAGDRVHFCRSYRFDCRIFVLDTPPTGTDIALLTILKSRENRPGVPPVGVSNEAGLSSARLEMAHVDLAGRITPEGGANFLVPLDGPPTIECGAFVELPSARTLADGAWTIREPGRPLRTWQRAGNELVNGTSCIKLIGEQLSPEWNNARADRGAWRRTDTVWIATRLGVAFRVERTIEQRDAAHRQAAHKSQLRYELDSSLQYPGQLSEERRQEITRARSFCEVATPLLSEPNRNAPQLAALLSRINLHLEHQPPTPYRDAILHLRRQVEAARRGEAPPVSPEQANERPSVAAVGQLAPDFVATDLTSGGTKTVRLHDWLGKPVILFFYNPASPTTGELLGFARAILARFNGGVAVVGLAVSDDQASGRSRGFDYTGSFPVLNGSGLRISYAVETTPKIVLIDATGIVRGGYLGWGRETPGEVLTALRQLPPHP